MCHVKETPKICNVWWHQEPGFGVEDKLKAAKTCTPVSASRGQCLTARPSDSDGSTLFYPKIPVDTGMSWETENAAIPETSFPHSDI